MSKSLAQVGVKIFPEGDALRSRKRPDRRDRGRRSSGRDTVQAFLPLLQAADAAHIVITASGVCSFMGVALNAPYCASKAAVLSYAETLYREMEASGSPIGVTALCPGAVSATLNLSERRRPANLPDLCETDLAPPGFRENLKKMRDQGLKPASVAQACLDAMREDRFYVITHPENGDMVEARGKDARAGRNPQPI